MTTTAAVEAARAVLAARAARAAGCWRIIPADADEHDGQADEHDHGHGGG